MKSSARLGVLFATLAWTALAQDASVPEPLRLEQALAFAEGHPRIRLGPNAVEPRRLPLYLACHDLAFGGAAAGDDRRNRPADALVDPVDAQRLEILARFLDVVLADLSFVRYDEAMAVAYVQYDRANNRQELGQFSDLRVAELNAAYQDIRRYRAASEAAQRLTRSLLAQAMDRPGTLPRDLSAPQIPPQPDPLPDVKEVVAQAAARNRALAALKASAGSAENRVLDLDLRQQAVELLLRLQTLAVAADGNRAEIILRDLKLDEARVLYEQEAAADLGYSMSQQTKAHLDEQRIAYCRALTWAELQALQGRPVWPRTDGGVSP